MEISEASSSTSHSLIERARRRDQRAWERLVRLYGPLVYRWARQCQLQPDDAADISQEVFHAVARSLGDFEIKAPGASFRGWLWTITRNCVRGHFRSRQRRTVAAGGSAAHAQFQEIPGDLLAQDAAPDGAAERVQLVHRALSIIREDFDERTWKAFWRMAIEEAPADEIAQDLNMTSKGVRQAKYRVLCRLRETCEHL